MYHAGLTASGCWDKMDNYDHQAIEKFAELIVQDCIKIAELGLSQPVAMVIRQRFGVEQ
jgi:hypothetical protein